LHPFGYIYTVFWFSSNLFFLLTTFLFKGCCALLGIMSEEKVEKKKEIKKDEFGDVVEEKEEVKAEKD
jgi:chromate transport protein ChrA